jgi:hypothetical protein
MATRFTEATQGIQGFMGLRLLTLS